MSPQAWWIVWAHFHARPEWRQWLRRQELAPGTLRMAPPAQPLRDRIEALLLQAHQLASSGLPNAKPLASTPWRRRCCGAHLSVSRFSHLFREQVGSSSQFHFASRFRRRLGTSPSAYRAVARDAR